VNDGAYDGCATDCSAKGPHCGDAEVSGDEACDDGVNDGSYGGCMTGCLALGPRCGDGAVSGIEACDDGVNDGAYGGCEPGCAILANHCGDAQLTDGEVCDDGLNDGTYGSCSADCLGEGPRCGDALVSGVEDCDDGVNDGSYGHCPVGCVGQAAYCNDGKTDSPDEACDDGVNNGKYDYCAAGCQGPGPHCGDSIKNGGEVCDDGVNDGSYGGCSATCGGFAPFCGDGIENGPDDQEGCDDGTNNGKYGKCSADCSGPGLRCGDGVKNGPEVCDDGADNGSYGQCKADCTGTGPRCGDAIKNGPEACDDGTNNGSYGGCAVGCGALGPRCGDGVKNGPEECDDANADNTDDCSNACQLPAFLVTYDGLPPDNAPLDQKVEVFFSRGVDAATLVAANITVKAGGVPVELKFLPSSKSVELQVARWEPNTTYTITVGTGVKDALGNALPAVSTRTFATKSTYADGSSLLMGAPLAMVDFQTPAALQSPGAYSPIATPHEYVLLGVDAEVNDAISILDHKPSNTFPEQVPANSVLWNSPMTDLRTTPKRAVRARLDADVRDEVAVVARPTPEGPLELMVIDPTPTANGRGTTYSTKPISSAIGPANTMKLFDLAAGQADDDPYEELFVLVGGGYTMDPNNSIDGKLRLYVFDDAAANHALLKSVVLKSHAFPITGVSLAVGDVDRDGTDEVAVVYNVNTDSDAYGWQTTVATLYKQKSGGFEAVEVPLDGGAWPPSERQQEYNPAQMVKIAIVNVDDDPSQRELVVSKLNGGKDYSSTQGIQIFRYAPAETTPLVRLGSFHRDVSVSIDSFQPHPDKVLAAVEVNEGSQKELLLMDGTIVRFERDPYTQVPKLTTLVDEPVFRFDPWVYSVAVGEVEARTFDAAGKAEQDHRSDEIVLLKSSGMEVYAIDELRDGAGVITGYQRSNVNNVPGIQSPSMLGNALLVLADVDHDGIYGKFVSRTTKLSENHIIALIAAPPCHPQMEGCSSEIAFGESHSGSNEVSGTASVSASAGFHLLADATATLVVGASVTIEEIDIDVSVKATAGFSYTYTKEYTKTITYGTTKEHMVVFSTTPYEMYNYKLVAHPVLGSVKPGNDSFFVAVPKPPAIYALSKPLYDKQTAAEADKVKGILASTPGVLTSYEKIENFDTWATGKDIKVVDIKPGDQVITTPGGGTYGTSTTGIELGVSTTSTFRGSLFVEVEAALRVCTAAVCVGGAVGAGAGYAFSYSFTDSVSFSGTLGNVVGESKYGVLMTPHRVRREQMINDDAVTQDFLVLDYLVGPPGPPVL
jgi:cysteine-rich repeat protein